MSILLIFVYGLFFLIYVGSPLKMQMILFVINLFANDPLPYIDEVIMAGSIIRKLCLISDIMDFLKQNPWIKYVAAALVAIAVLALIF